MNRISFKGSHVIVGGIVSVIFGAGASSPAEPARNDGRRGGRASSSGEAARVRKRCKRRLRGIWGTAPVDPEHLDILVDFLIACGVTGKRLDRLTGERPEALAALAKDVETLRRYRRDGTITDVRIVDEWPF